MSLPVAVPLEKWRGQIILVVASAALIVLAVGALAALVAGHLGMRRRMREARRRTAALRLSQARLRESERRLRVSEAHLERAQRIAATGSWEIDLVTGRFSHSAEIARLFGMGEREAVERETLLGRVHPEDRAAARAFLDAAIPGAEPIGCELAMDYRVIRSDGAIRDVHREGEVVRDESGRARAIIGTIQDVTEMRRMDAERRGLEAQLRHSQRLESLGTLAGGIAHHFNNLLPALSGHLEIAMEEAGSGNPAQPRLQRLA